MIKNISVSFLLALFFFLQSDYAGAEQTKPLSLEKQWEAFIENPTPDQVPALVKENDWNRLQWLQNKIKQGDVKALRAAIMLSEASAYDNDEITSGLLHCAIASVIVPYPQLYIEQLYKKPETTDQTLGCTETSVMCEYDFEEMVTMFEQRIKALQNVGLTDKDQDKFRKEAVEQLKNTIQTINTEFLSKDDSRKPQPVSFYPLDPETKKVLEEQWQDFVKTPSKEKAENLLKSVNETDDAANSFGGSEWLESKILELRQNMEQGDETSFKVTFMLREFSDGHLSEEFDIVIAFSIIPQPKLYLDYAYQYKGEGKSSWLQTGWDLIDNDQGQVDILEKRIKALQDVVIQNKALAAFRDQVVENLKDEIKMISQ